MNRYRWVKSSSGVAQAVVHEFHRRMQMGPSLPVFSTDGLRLNFYALTAHFGQWGRPGGSGKRAWQIAADFVYGQVKKVQRRRRLIKVELQMLWGEWGQLRTRLKAAGVTGRLNTAFVERLNLTLRQGVALLTRRTWGTAQHMSELSLHVEWGRGYYHFARYHEALRTKLLLPVFLAHPALCKPGTMFGNCQPRILAVPERGESAARAGTDLEKNPKGRLRADPSGWAHPTCRPASSRNLQDNLATRVPAFDYSVGLGHLVERQDGRNVRLQLPGVCQCGHLRQDFPYGGH